MANLLPLPQAAEQMAEKATQLQIAATAYKLYPTPQMFKALRKAYDAASSAMWEVEQVSGNGH